MHARVEHAKPQQDAEHYVVACMEYLQHVEQAQQHTDANGCGEPGNGGRLPIEERDHDDAQQIIGDGERGEKHLCGRCHLVSCKRHDAQRKGDIGRDGHGPAANVATGVKDAVYQGGHSYAATCCEDGHECMAWVGEDTGGELVFKLDTYGEEEDRHEEVVDKALE